MQAELEAVLKREIPRCQALISAERLSGGASQETYRLTIRESDGGDRLLALRRAPGGHDEGRVSYYPGLAAEALLMQSAKAAGVPEPEVFYVLKDRDGLGNGFIMSWLEGEALGARIVRSPDLAEIRPKLAYECGQILARIHAIDLKATGLDQCLSRLSPEEYVHNTWDRYKAFNTPQPMIDYTGRWLLDHLPDVGAEALVHNDFRNGNLMISPKGVVAVLDWEVAHIGDPMRDLGWICTNSWRFGRTDLAVGGFGTYDDLFAGYQSVSGQVVDPQRVKFWEVFGSFWWAIGCLGMADHYRTGPDASVERPAIGRRSSECQVDCVNLLIPGPVELVSEPDSTNDEMPRNDELLISVRNFLHGDVMAETEGRTNFMARVAGNSLDIVLRDQALGPAHRHLERQRLNALFVADDSLENLRWRLVNGLRLGEMALDHPGLAHHLRQTVVNQIAIDQPKYSGFKTALGHNTSERSRFR
ncbi:MAG: phosphotransferase family protein [Rhodospirillaceae bacterium]|jgi:aminoglycoside phosphotransferase (APT) family kinase protein|nr:phosphotransferase family protein [Rhodospirillaceae bacterium]MBT4687680.1 phosphotransferase family protein [Rhodospirillaceae bacterium]MBT5082896.1 phosphotransferase family protein [Rhodospirillaceae bacterium]MBT5524340.1 phosphotransferase family protein [Rhodospirillaceae bacterium]MBT5878864.1 phosphotransferase family protein [Rhodospirillaceae bacterium]